MIIQQWSGYITEISLINGEFNAVIKDITNPNNPEELITANINNFSKDEIPHLSTGVIFNWFIIEEDNINKSQMQLIKITNKERAEKRKLIKKYKKIAKRISHKINR